MRKYLVKMMKSDFVGYLPLILNSILFVMCITLLKLQYASGLAPIIIFLFINFMPALLFQMLFDFFNKK